MAGSDETNEDDRRRADRVPINHEFSGDDGTWVSDLSQGGVFVHGAQLLPVGSTIDLRFTVLLDDPVVIAAVGKVVRHSRRPPGIGVQFTDLEPDMRARIDAVLDSQRPIDSGAPLRLPEPQHGEDSDDSDDSDEDATLTSPRWARPAPVGDLSVVPTKVSEDEDVTTSFVRPDVAGAATSGVFLPPPLPGAGKAVDEDERTRQYPTLRRGPNDS